MQILATNHGWSLLLLFIASVTNCVFAGWLDVAWRTCGGSPSRRAACVLDSDDTKTFVRARAYEFRTSRRMSGTQTADALGEMRQTRFLIAYLLAAICGLRRGEIAALRWKNVDLDAGVLRIVQTTRQIGKVVTYKPVKNTKGRPVALSALMLEELKAHRAKQVEELLRFGIKLSGDSFVFAQPDGSPIKPGSVTNEWKRLAKKHALPRIRFHDLRHTHATAMLASGVHPKIASERLGHSSIAITLDLYSHVLPNMQADAIQTLDNDLRAAISKRSSK
jgi:integrase